MNDLSKEGYKQPKSFRISDILGDELCERKRRRESESREYHFSSRNFEDDYMVLKSRRSERTEDVSEDRTSTQTDFAHRHIPHWIPMFSSSLKCDKEERLFAGKSLSHFAIFHVICT